MLSLCLSEVSAVIREPPFQLFYLVLKTQLQLREVDKVGKPIWIDQRRAGLSFLPEYGLPWRTAQ
jgi:hypothetical protein